MGGLTYVVAESENAFLDFALSLGLQERPTVRYVRRRADLFKIESNDLVFLYGTWFKRRDQANIQEELLLLQASGIALYTLLDNDGPAVPTRMKELDHDSTQGDGGTPQRRELDPH